MSARKQVVRDRFYRFVPVADADSCWLWKGGRVGRGYGAFKLDGHMIQAHRVAWMLEHGPIGEGLYICHSCDVKLCVNPTHLFLGDNAVNQIDAVAKGIHHGHKGELHPLHKLTVKDVQRLRSERAEGKSARALAASFGLNVSYVYQIVNREVWREVA